MIEENGCPSCGDKIVNFFPYMGGKENWGWYIDLGSLVVYPAIYCPHCGYRLLREENPNYMNGVENG